MLSEKAKKMLLVFLVLGGMLTLLFLAAYAALFVWLPRQGEESFRRLYSPGFPRFETSDSMFAVEFGGTCGLQRLRRLRDDPAIHRFGRERAEEVIRYIESGKHVNDLQYEIDFLNSRGYKIPLLYRYAQFVIWHDRGLVTK